MALDGTYGFVYCGVNGLGVGIFSIKGERFEGIDYGGLRYAGTAHENPDGSIWLAIEFDVVPGATLYRGRLLKKLFTGERLNRPCPRTSVTVAPCLFNHHRAM
jgi:hypothetical protein